MTITLNRRVEKFSREACASTVGGAKSLNATIASRAHHLLRLLDLRHLLADDPQPLDGVGRIDGKRRAEDGEPVAQHSALILRAQADRDQPPQLEALRP